MLHTVVLGFYTVNEMPVFDYLNKSSSAPLVVLFIMVYINKIVPFQPPVWLLSNADQAFKNFTCI